MGDDHRRAVLEVRGMTCDDCARRVARALEGAGASDVSVSWRAGEASFSWPGRRGADRLRSAVAAAGYAPGELRLTGADAVASEGTVAREGADADLVAGGAGSAAFAAATCASEAGRRVVLVEQGTLGGTCVNVGCVPSKALLQAAELAWAAGHHPYADLVDHLRPRRPRRSRRPEGRARLGAA
jgi:mercuric reductase